MSEEVSTLHIDLIIGPITIITSLLYYGLIYIGVDPAPKPTYFRRLFFNEKPYKIDDRDGDILFIESEQDLHNNYSRAGIPAIIYRVGQLVYR